MTRYVRNNGGESAYFNGVMVWNCNMMLSVLLGGKADVAPGLPGRRIAKWL